MSDKPNETKDFESEQVAYDATKAAVEERADLSKGMIVAFFEPDGMRVMSMKASLRDMLHLHHALPDQIKQDMLEGGLGAKQ